MKKILLIEDQKDISNNIKDFLELNDFFVKQVFN
jgi:DNA-binding response OmpR family regulator